MANNIWFNLLKNYADTQSDKLIFKEADTEGLTYREFYNEVCRVSSMLLSSFNGKLPDDPIAVTVERNVSSLIAIMAVCAAGGWYVPIDSSLPQDRAEMLLSVCSPAAILFSTQTDPFPSSDILKLHIEDAVSDSLDCYRERSEELPLFGIFTSGSTGTPKLVVKDGRGIREFIESYCQTFDLSASERFGNQIPFYFDASTKDIFSTLYLGASTVIFPQKLFSFPMKLVQALVSEGITSFVCVPSVMSAVAQYNVFDVLAPEHLKNVLFVGERMTIRHLNYWFRALPNTRFVNLYGSTEVAGNSCYYMVRHEFDENDILPIGQPFPTSKVFLLGEDGVPANEGEICVLGNGLAIGYYKDEEKTSAAFINGSFPESGISGRYYHSGDFGRINHDGDFVCVSRKDSQIKITGHRIELGDIEAAASGIDYVNECCCLFSKEKEALILFAACDPEKKRELKKELMKRLPKYMIPQFIICREELAHNRNGKLDRAGLLKEWNESEVIL